MEKVDIKFILFHRPTAKEIEMPVLSICEEYSHIAFSARGSDYDGDYDGIGRLPSYPGNSEAKDYDVYVVVNGTKYEYSGEEFRWDM